jgi:outer membrane lipoprotein LolB
MRHLVGVGLAVLLAACATPRPAVQTLPSQGLSLDMPWSLQGRIAIKAGENSQSGQLQWRHRKGREELLLLSPLGQGVARLVSDAEGVLLEVPNKPPRRAPDAENLTLEALGVALPLSGLRYWIGARPDPARPFEQSVDTHGGITQIRQDGWVIDYLQYMRDVSARPRKLTIARNGLEIRLVIDTWELE